MENEWLRLDVSPPSNHVTHVTIQLKGSGDLSPEDSPTMKLYLINWRGRGAESNISNTRESDIHQDIQTLRRELKIQCPAMAYYSLR